MASHEGTGGLRIGETLETARASQGLDLRTVEEHTKIRIKYLRALEAEDWDVLPGPAYAIGFLRTYAELLGLDDDELVGELRRQVGDDAPADQRYPLLGEPVLTGRRRRAEGRPGRRLAVIVIGLVVVAGAALALAGVLGGEDEPAPTRGQEAGNERASERSDANGASQEESGGPVTLHLTLRADVPVCLLGGGSQPLVDNQVLNAGSEEDFEEDRFELRFPEGFDRSQVELRLNGERTKLEDPGVPAAFKITAPARVKALGPPAEDCP